MVMGVASGNVVDEQTGAVVGTFEQTSIVSACFTHGGAPARTCRPHAACHPLPAAQPRPWPGPPSPPR